MRTRVSISDVVATFVLICCIAVVIGLVNSR